MDLDEIIYEYSLDLMDKKLKNKIMDVRIQSLSFTPQEYFIPLSVVQTQPLRLSDYRSRSKSVKLIIRSDIQTALSYVRNEELYEKET